MDNISNKLKCCRSSQNPIIYYNNGTIVNVNSNYNVGLYDYYIGVNSLGNGDITITIPLGELLNKGKLFIIKDESGKGSLNGYRIIIQMSGSDLLDGHSTTIVALNNAALQILWTGSRWSIV